MRNIEINKVNFCIVDSAAELDLKLNNIKKSDMVLCGYSMLPEVDFDSEKSVGVGELWDVSLKSTKYSTPTFCAAMTRYKGYKRMSVILLENGDIIDIADRTQNLREDDCNNSNKIKVYKTEKGRVALLIDTDILFNSNWEKISKVASIVIGIAQNITDEQATKIFNLSKFYNIPFLLTSTTGIWWRDKTN